MPERSLTDADLVLASARLTLAETDALAERFGDPSKIAAQSAARLESSGLSPTKAAAITSPDADLIDRTRAWLEDDGHHLLRAGDADYPRLLEDIASPPPWLFVNGDLDAFKLATLAIVGSRNPTEGGRRNAFEFAETLAATGFCIVSGLALGIDAAAHRGALAAGGATVAFLGHGIDRVYPAEHRELAHEIAAHGALASEFPIGTPPDKRHFPQRNRLISGASLGTLVVEAARRSGSLITARLSGEQGREVFALPGSIHNPMARGCHELIRSGAKLVESSDDILSELSQWVEHLQKAGDERPAAPIEPADEEHRRLLDIMGHDPIGVDALAQASGLTIGELSSMLLILELEGKVEKLSGGQYATTR